MHAFMLRKWLCPVKNIVGWFPVWLCPRSMSRDYKWHKCNIVYNLSPPKPDVSLTVPTACLLLAYSLRTIRAKLEEMPESPLHPDPHKPPVGITYMDSVSTYSMIVYGLRVFSFSLLFTVAIGSYYNDLLASTLAFNFWSYFCTFSCFTSYT